MTEWQLRCKDDSPQNTIDKINSIFDKYGLKTTLEEFDSGLTCSFSCKLNIVDDKGRILHRSCGKGMTKKLSIASAYGEMMERLQSRYLVYNFNHFDKKIDEVINLDNPLYDVYDENQPVFIKKIYESIAKTIDFPTFGINPYDFVIDYIASLSPLKDKGKFPSISYYSINENKNVYLPSWLTQYSKTKGLAAGNTLEEAMVEGLSELCEIYSQMKLFEGKIIPPEIPRKEIEKYPHLIDMINQIENNGKYQVRLFDYSLGIGLPVICGNIINKDTGHFSNKCGSHPNMYLAIERVLTETLQGRTIDEVVENDYVDFYAKNSKERIDKWNLLKVGKGRVVAQQYMDKPTYEYKSWDDVGAFSNKQLLKYMINIFQKLNKEIYIHDYSYMGFPTVHIYIPEISEVIDQDMYSLKDWKLKIDTQYIFSHLDSASNDDLSTLLVASNLNMLVAVDNSINVLSGNIYDKKMPGDPAELMYLSVVLNYYFGKYKDAINLLELMLSNKEIFDIKCLNELECLKNYILGIASSTEINKVKDVLRRLFPNISVKIFDLFDNKNEIILKLYPNCPNHECTNCKVKECIYPELHELYAKLVKAEKKCHMDNSNIEKLFKGV